MSSNEKLVLEKYADPTGEDGRAERITDRAEFHYTKRQLAPFITPESKVLEVGCATGHYGMYYAGRCREYLGIDLVPSQIGLFREKIAAAGLTNVRCQVGDATALNGIADGEFDVVLCLGPMYHLAAEEREKAAEECARVCRSGGIAAFAYINIIGTYAGACVDWPGLYPSEAGNGTLITMEDDLRPGLFRYSSPEEMEALVSRHGLSKLKNRATDFMFLRSAVSGMDEERLRLLEPLYDALTESESCTGTGGHALIICRKE